uniref:GRAM domain-containing protein n=1 Tax=Clastoptera arizonana TaxID=38151 RepID=A0A1B6EGK2_9HEMI
MMCLVQGFSEKVEQEKPKKFRRLSILRRKKSPSPNTPKADENLLHPNDARVAAICFGENNSQKELNSNRSAMTHAQDLVNAQQTAAAAAAVALLSATPGSSKARQKKFHRHFKQVDSEERVLDYFSCALVADILLQGILYITKNYFAFYSNVFGYTTKLLIPTTSVLSVTKEKTAYIIPNAVGITTEDGRHVFGSLLSRESTYKLMVQVWSTAVTSLPANLTNVSLEKAEDFLSGDERKNDEDSSLSGSESLTERDISAKTEVHALLAGTTEIEKQNVSKVTGSFFSPYLQLRKYCSNLPTSKLLLIISTLLIILLSLSSTFLIYRINRIQNNHNKDNMYNSRSFGELNNFISDNKQLLHKVLQSLEALSTLIEVESLSKTYSHDKMKMEDKSIQTSHDGS